MVTLYREQTTTNKTVHWKGEDIELNDVFLIRMCGLKVEFNYKEKPKAVYEKCRTSEIMNLIEELTCL